MNNNAIYRPRKLELSPLWNILKDHLDDYIDKKQQAITEETDGKSIYIYHNIEEVFRKYLDCGDFKKGFARIRCSECKTEYLLAFSCRCRWFCPSCHQKKVLLFGEFILNEVASVVPHRQYVFSLPIMLRCYFKNNKKLLSKLCRLAQESLIEYMRLILNKNDGEIAMIIVIQTFCEYLNYHSHLHAIVADGLFAKNGSFYVMPEKDNKKLTQLFRLKVINMLVKENLLAEKMANKLLSWHHSGFSVYRGSQIHRNNKKALEKLSQYIIRNPINDEKIIYKADTATVIYKSKYNLKIKGNFKLFKVYDFIDALSQHIPRKGYQMVRYYGWYSNKKRGLHKKQDNIDNPININPSSCRRRIPSKKWRELIKKVWEVDPLECPKCKSEMKIISLIDDKLVIAKILHHLDLWQDNVGRSPPQTIDAADTQVKYVPVCNEYGYWPDVDFNEA